MSMSIFYLSYVHYVSLLFTSILGLVHTDDYHALLDIARQLDVHSNFDDTRVSVSCHTTNSNEIMVIAFFFSSS